MLQPNASPYPFVRAYSPALEAFSVEETDFIAFLDNLALIQAGQGSMKMLDVGGLVIGMAPEPTMMLAGMAMQGAAAYGNAVRTKRFLEKTDAEYFRPRGLRVSLKKDKELSPLLGGMDIENAVAPLNASINQVTLRDRRLAALSPYVAPLELTNIPLPPAPGDRGSRMSVKEMNWKKQQKEKSELKKQQKLAAKPPKEESERQQKKNAKKVKKLDYVVIENLY